MYVHEHHPSPGIDQAAPVVISATYFGRIQFDASVIEAFFTTQSECPAVRSIRSTADDPSASAVRSYPPAKLNRRPGSGSQVASISAPATRASKFRLTDVRSTICET